MIESLENKIEKKLDKIVIILEDILASNLVGIYLHGSLAMKCFNEDKSDIDILVVVKDTMTLGKKKSLIDSLIELEGRLPKNDIEMSVILESDLKLGSHPMFFNLHYSKMHKSRYLEKSELCQDGYDPDLTCHLAMIQARGVRLSGKPIKDLGIHIRKSDFLDSVMRDIEYDQSDLIKSPEYVILNLCRTLKYLYDGSHVSKLEGGQWAIKRYGANFNHLICEVIKKYRGQAFDLSQNTEKINSLAEALLQRVREQVKYERG